jgi:DNA-binding IclR family transcriptional regulator
MIQSVSRAIDILEAVAGAEAGLRLSEIADATGLKANTAHNLAGTLVQRGYVEKVDGPLYRLGPAAARLSERSSRSGFVAAGAEALREAVQQAPQATWVLSERMGGQIVVVLRMSPDRPGVLQRPQGTTFHPYANASGLALMAFLPEGEVLALREQHPFYEFGAHLWGTIGELNEFLDDVRDRGYAVPPFPDQAGFRAAAPVRDRHGNVLGAFGGSMGARSHAATDEMIKRVVRSAAKLTSSLQSGPGT